jgi:hypothetical protein
MEVWILIMFDNHIIIIIIIIIITFYFTGFIVLVYAWQYSGFSTK